MGKDEVAGSRQWIHVAAGIKVKMSEITYLLEVEGNRSRIIVGPPEHGCEVLSEIPVEDIERRMRLKGVEDE